MEFRPREAKGAADKEEWMGLAMQGEGRAAAKAVATGVGRSVGERAEPMEADLEAEMEVDAAASANTDLEAAPPLW